MVSHDSNGARNGSAEICSSSSLWGSCLTMSLYLPRKTGKKVYSSKSWWGWVGVVGLGRGGGVGQGWWGWVGVGLVAQFRIQLCSITFSTYYCGGGFASILPSFHVVSGKYPHVLVPTDILVWYPFVQYCAITVRFHLKTSTKSFAILSCNSNIARCEEYSGWAA